MCVCVGVCVCACACIYMYTAVKDRIADVFYTDAPYYG